MFLQIQHAPDVSTTLVEPAVCGSLAVVAAGAISAAQLDRLLRASGWGRGSGPDAAALSVLRLRAEAVRGGCAPADFERMLSFASTRGWLSADGQFVTAHVERK